MDYVLDRKQSYNHRTTSLVEWRVINKQTGFIVAVTKTKKDALEWLAVYNSPTLN
jgi:hypothetical protein